MTKHCLIFMLQFTNSAPRGRSGVFEGASHVEERTRQTEKEPQKEMMLKYLIGCSKSGQLKPGDLLALSADFATKISRIP